MSDTMMTIPSNEWEHLEIEPSNSFNSRFGVKDNPQVYFVNTDAKVFGDLPAPSDDEGRNLIKAINEIRSVPK